MIRKRNMTRNKKNNIYYLLILLILGIGIGYAYLNTELQISGTTNVSSANWNIYWDNIQFGTNNVTDVTTPATISSGLTEVTFNVNFSQPGDTYEFTVDAVNDGTINGMISVVNSGVFAANGTTPKTLPDYLEYTVTYYDGVAIAPNHLLGAGNTETYKVKVHYKEDISASQLPSTNDNYVFKFSVTYVQADTNASVVNHPKYVYTVNERDFDLPLYNGVGLNQTIPANIIQYNNPVAAMNAFSASTGDNKTFYLKHKLENNVVTETYVEFVITPETVQACPGMIAGTYSLRGGFDEQNLSNKPYYDANKELIKQAFGYTTDSSRCEEDNYTFMCHSCSEDAIGIFAIDNIDGGILAGDGISWWSCVVEKESGNLVSYCFPS